MGRDWAPWEQYASEQENIAMGRGDYWHFLKNTVFHSASGEKIRLCSDEELTLRKQFPILGKLMCSNGDYSFTSLYEKLSKIDGGLDLLSRKDKELAEFIASGKGDENCYLIKWFFGKLDPGFYYSEHNHHLFGESLLNEAVLRANKDKSVVSVVEEFTDDVKQIEKSTANATAASICGLFEEILEKYDITIPDKEREGAESEARLYGTTYYALEDDIVKCLNEYTDRNKYNIAKNVDLENFKNAIECLDYNPDDYTEAELLDMYDTHFDKLSNDDTYNSIYNETLSEVLKEYENNKRDTKSPEKMSFIDDLMDGKAVFSDIDKYVEYWHTHDTGNTLQEFLGLTNDEMEAWAKSCQTRIDKIIDRAKQISEKPNKNEDPKANVELEI